VLKLSQSSDLIHHVVKPDRDRPRTRHAFGGQDGWTFVETLIVIGIILILTSTVGFMAFRYVDKARVVATRNQIEELSMALHSYYLDCKQYPAPQQGLDALWEKPVLEPVPAGWEGPYLTKKIQDDPWGHPYKYTVPGPSGLPFGIASFGPSGVEGSEGGIASWSN
jgi:general secretion pathway protein G